MTDQIVSASLPGSGNNEPTAPVTSANIAHALLMTNSFETGGSERQFIALAQHLDPARFSLKLGCLSERGPLRQQVGKADVFPMGGRLYSVKSLHSRIRLARYLRHQQIDVAHAFDFYTNLVMIPVARWARVAVVLGSQRQIGDLLTPAQRRAQLWAFRFCDKVVCNSQAAADRLQEYGLLKQKLAVIANGVAAAAFEKTAPALPATPGLMRVGMIARMNHRVKNHDVFLKAAACVAANLNNVEFVLVGDGPLRAELEKLAQDAGIAGQVRFLGDRRDIPAILASLDLTVLPSDSESLSNSIIESMAAGVPVIATRVGGNAELVDDDRGQLVSAGDEQDLAAAMLSLLRDHARRQRLAENARSFALSRFTIEKMCRAHEELYTELLHAKKARGLAARR